MATYSIKDLENIVGIKAHTIRIWEQRYKLLQPKRTKTNIRYYTGDDLQLLLTVDLLRNNKHKISAIAKMSPAQRQSKVKALPEVNFTKNSQLDALTLAMLAMDQKKFSQIINANIKQLGFKQTMLDVIVPFIAKIQELLIDGPVTSMHFQFITNVICQKIIVAIEKLNYCCCNNSQSFLLYSPDENSLDLKMLFAHYLLKELGGKIIYIGNGVRFEDLAALREKPDYLFAMINTMSFTHCQEYINFVCNAFPECKYLFSGFSLNREDLHLPPNALSLLGYKETIEFIESLSKKQQ